VLVTYQPPFAETRPATRAAVEWAAQLHAGQRRPDDVPFVMHPLEVAELLSSSGYGDDIVIAPVLHDIVEKAGATIADVRERFGDEVAGLVAAVTEDATIADYGARKAALRKQVASAGPDVHALYAADKVCKVRELRAQARRDPRSVEHYAESLEMLCEVTRDLPLVEKLAFELWALRAS
jgi:(p)ppGpp synthase/HD superfamily hydrolase